MKTKLIEKTIEGNVYVIKFLDEYFKLTIPNISFFELFKYYIERKASITAYKGYYKNDKFNQILCKYFFSPLEFSLRDKK
jgi:hypothetical protein